MTNYGTTTTHRPTPTAPSPPPPPPPTSHNNQEPENPPRKNMYTLTLSFPFNIPSTPESAAVRIVKNLEKFSLYYTIFVWTVLFISLIPQRKVSIVYLVATTEVTILYLLLLRAFPDSVILHKIIDKRFVLFMLFVVTCLELILTRAALHLVIVLAATVPVVLIHALLSKRDDVFVQEERGEMARLVQEKLGDVCQPENLV